MAVSNDFTDILPGQPERSPAAGPAPAPFESQPGSPDSSAVAQPVAVRSPISCAGLPSEDATEVETFFDAAGGNILPAAILRGYNIVKEEAAGEAQVLRQIKEREVEEARKQKERKEAFDAEMSRAKAAQDAAVAAAEAAARIERARLDALAAKEAKEAAEANARKLKIEQDAAAALEASKAAGKGGCCIVC